jgi:uncharacterized protein (TIGR03437 family)
MLLAGSCLFASPQKVTTFPAGPMHVEGNVLVDETGRKILLRGSNVSDEATAGPGEFAPLSATAFSTIRLRWNMNAVRLRLNTAEYRRNTEYRERVRLAVRTANALELVVILAARESLDVETAEFWKQSAFDFRNSRSVIFEVDGEGLASVIRAAGAHQPVLVAGAVGGETKNVMTEMRSSFLQLRTESERDSVYARDPKKGPVLAMIDNLELAGPSCSSLPEDPSWLEGVVEASLDYFDRNDISWIVSSFAPGQLIADRRNFSASTLENGFDCEHPGAPLAGIGMSVQFHLWDLKVRGLITVHGQTGNFVLARGGLAIAYGPTLPNAEEGSFPHTPPLKLGGISVRVTDSHGRARLAGLLYVLAGWGQVNFVVPAASALGPAVIEVIHPDGTVSASPAIIGDYAPGLSGEAGNGRGPVIGEVIQKSADGNVKAFKVGSCDTSHCSTNAISLSPGVDTVAKLVGNGFRAARSPAEIDVRIGGVRVPVVSWGPSADAGLDQISVGLPDQLRGIGEADLIARVNGHPANVVRIRIQ